MWRIIKDLPTNKKCGVELKSWQIIRDVVTNWQLEMWLLNEDVMDNA